MQHRSEQAFDRYREERKRMKAIVTEAKREAEDRLGTKLSQNFERNRKMLWEKR